MKTNVVYIGLGSNLAEPIKQLTHALAQLNLIDQTRVTASSSIYLSKPLGPQDQPDFANSVAQLNTQLSPQALIAELQAIEQKAGRVRKEQRWGARILDLDILLFGNDIINTDSLVVPHYDMVNREFVIYPLAEIAPELSLPNGQKIADIKRSLSLNDMVIAS